MQMEYFNLERKMPEILGKSSNAVQSRVPVEEGKDKDYVAAIQICWG